MSRANTYAILQPFPYLKQLYSIGKLKISSETVSPYYGDAPESTLPPMPASTTNSASGKDKKKTAFLWLDYINQISELCKFPQTELKKYFGIERAKIRDGDFDKLIELRQKCAMFIEKNYCNK